VGKESEACHAAHDVMRKVKKCVFGKDVWHMRDQGPLSREDAPLMISGGFAASNSVALVWMSTRIRQSVSWVPLPQVHDKMYGLTI